jgi:thymidylate synthase
MIHIDGFKQTPFWVSAECMTELLGLNPSLSFQLTRSKAAKEILQQMTHPTGFHQYTYGQRMADWHVLEKTLDRLDDENSRQALFTIYDNRDLYEWSIPCTILHQYSKRNGKLDLTVYYRSNDFYRGFRNDIYFSSVCLELMSA